MLIIDSKTLSVTISVAIILTVQGCSTHTQNVNKSADYIGAVLPFQQPANQSIAKKTLAQSTFSQTHHRITFT